MSVVQTAYNYLGTPYVWGGTSPSGFDCSGLVQYSYAQNGLTVPRTSEEQYAYTANSRIKDKSQLRPGDLVFFNTGSTASHVGIYIGNNQFIHAPHTGDVVKVSELSGYYAEHFDGGGRVDGSTSGAITAGGGTSEGDTLNFFGKIVAFLACILLAVVAVVLFAKAFDIPTSTNDLIKKAVGSSSKKTTTTTPDTSEEITEDIPTVVGEVVEPVRDVAYMIDDKISEVTDLVLY